MAAGDFRDAAAASLPVAESCPPRLASTARRQKPRKDFLFFLRGKFLFHFADAFPVAFAIFAGIGAFRLGAIERTAIAIRRHDFVGLEKQAGVSFVKQINVAERNRADRVAVIRAVERKEFRP